MSDSISIYILSDRISILNVSMYGCYASFCTVGESFARVRYIIDDSHVSANASIVIETIDVHMSECR